MSLGVSMKYPIPEVRLSGGPVDGRVLKNVRGARIGCRWTCPRGEILTLSYAYITGKDGEVRTARYDRKETMRLRREARAALRRRDRELTQAIDRAFGRA